MSELPDMISAVVQDNRSSSVVSNNYGSKPVNDFFDSYTNPYKSMFAQ